MGIKAGRYGAAFNCVFFRKEMPMLDDAIERSKQIYREIGAKYSEHKKTWRFPGGGRLRFRPLERTSDAEKYQGQNLSDVCIEEAGNFASQAPIQRLHAVLRSGAGVPTQMHLTGNPGGPGQFWIKERYIDHDPSGFKRIQQKLPNGDIKSRIFIPAKVTDNQILLKNDPGYVGNLYLVGSSQLVSAWLNGDWNAIEGAYFDCWSSDIIIEPFEIPRHWLRFRSFDWGSAAPFSVGWWAISSGDILPDGRYYPPGAMIRYREWYGKKSANVGLKLTAREVARGILARTLPDEEISYTVADPSVFAVDGGPSIAEESFNEGLAFTRANNKRVAGMGAVGGWDQMRSRMKGDGERPMIHCFSTCTDSTRTIPMMQHDELRPEDLDTDLEDHAADEWRYACMSRPWTAPLPEPKLPSGPTFNDLLKISQQRARN
jgi:hypothetical protein